MVGMTIKHSLLSVASVLALSVAAMGCSAASQDPTVAQDTKTQESSLSRAPVAPEAKGPSRLAAKALSNVALSAPQRTAIEALFQKTSAHTAPMLSAKIALADTAAKQLEAGRIDRAQLQPDIDTLVKLASAAQADHRAAIQSLHDLLTVEQRKEFVAALETEMKAARKHGHKRWQQPPEGESAEQHAPSLRHAFKELNLTDDQEKQLRFVMFEAFKDHAGEAADLWKTHHGKMGQALEAFPKDDFKVDTALPAVDMAAMAARMTPKVLDTAGKMLPVLDGTQRAMLGKRMRERARIEPQATNPTEITPDLPLAP